MYEQALGVRFLHLPANLQIMHSRVTNVTGRVNVEHGKNWIANALVNWLGLPAAAERQPLTVSFVRGKNAETWRRSFAGHPLVSKQTFTDGAVCEQIGPVKLVFELVTDGKTLDLQLQGARLFGIRLPRPLMPKLTAQEWPVGDGVGFSVRVALPGVGQLIRYVGIVRPTNK